jgi:hypothetical protein
MSHILWLKLCSFKELDTLYMTTTDIKCINLVEVDRNRNFLAGTRNLPGIRFLLLVPGFEILVLPGSWFGYWF